MKLLAAIILVLAIHYGYGELKPGNIFNYLHSLASVARAVSHHSMLGITEVKQKFSRQQKTRANSHLNLLSTKNAV